MKHLLTAVFALLLVASFSAPASAQMASGKVTMLRVNNLNDVYGEPDDAIRVEVVIQLNNQTNRGYGFELRNDNNRPLRQGMLDLLRDAFNNNWIVNIDFRTPTRRRNNGVIFRIWLTK
jgi:curli biogenesis system outer membrane secretion channel CsgG